MAERRWEQVLRPLSPANVLTGLALVGLLAVAIQTASPAAAATDERHLRDAVKALESLTGAVRGLKDEIENVRRECRR